MHESGELGAAAEVVGRRIPANMHWNATGTHSQRVRKCYTRVKRGLRGRPIAPWGRFRAFGPPGRAVAVDGGRPVDNTPGSGRFGPFRPRLGTLLGVPRPAPAPSSSGLGHRLFTPATGVRVPLGSIHSKRRLTLRRPSGRQCPLLSDSAFNVTKWLSIHVVSGYSRGRKGPLVVDSAAGSFVESRRQSGRREGSSTRAGCRIGRGRASGPEAGRALFLL